MLHVVRLLQPIACVWFLLLYKRRAWSNISVEKHFEANHSNGTNAENELWQREGA